MQVFHFGVSRDGVVGWQGLAPKGWANVAGVYLPGWRDRRPFDGDAKLTHVATPDDGWWTVLAYVERMGGLAAYDCVFIAAGMLAFDQLFVAARDQWAWVFDRQPFGVREVERQLIDFSDPAQDNRPPSAPSPNCGYCRGSGRAVMRLVLERTLAAVPAPPATVSAPELAAAVGLKNPTTANSRLARLESMGLVCRTKTGGVYRWTRVDG